MGEPTITRPDPIPRRIIHVDMDAFFASVEQLDRPELRGKPVAVGGDPSRRGVVAAASYEARRFGVRSAVPMARAVRLCPELVVVPPRFARYREISGLILGFYRSVTPLVEPLSIDEAYLDVTENAWGLALGVDVARRLKEEIRATTGLTASAGVAPNKFLAKIGSGWRKPDGLTVIAPSRVEAFLQKLPVDAIWGVGPVTAGKLRALGCERLVDVRNVGVEALRRAVGSAAESIRAFSLGIDDRPVVPDRKAKSCGCEDTYPEDLVDPKRMEAEVSRMAERCSVWLARRGLSARTVTVKVRYSNFETVTRSKSEPAATRDPGEISARAVALLARTEAGRRPVRLLGVSVHGLEGSASVPLS